MAKKEGLGFTFKSLCLKMKARVSGGGICVRLRNKLSLLAGSSILIIAPCLAKPAVAADDDHALTHVSGVTAGMEDGYQSAGSSSSAGTSYAGIGYGDQLLTNPITLSKVPNFDFGYHKRNEGKSKFQLIDSTADKRVLIIKDENGHLNWTVTASLGENNVNNSQIKSDDVSISFYKNSEDFTDRAFLKTAVPKENPDFVTADSTAIDGLQMFDQGANISTGMSEVILQRNLNNSNNKKDSLAVMTSFVPTNSVQLNLALDNQPYTADKYVAPITWTLNVTN